MTILCQVIINFEKQSTLLLREYFSGEIKYSKYVRKFVIKIPVESELYFKFYALCLFSVSIVPHLTPIIVAIKRLDQRCLQGSTHSKSPTKTDIRRGLGYSARSIDRFVFESVVGESSSYGLTYVPLTRPEQHERQIGST